jgi:hypothetical protein
VVLFSPLQQYAVLPDPAGLECPDELASAAMQLYRKYVERRFSTVILVNLVISGQQTYKCRYTQQDIGIRHRSRIPDGDAGGVPIG